MTDPLPARAPLDAIFHPRSIAVVGASNTLHRAGGRRFRSLIESGFAGALHPVHPSAGEIQGRQSYRTLGEIGAAIDFVVVMVRPDLVEGVVEECAALGVPGVLVLTAGFGETGEAGRLLEQRIARRLREAGGRLVGPNCAGLFSGPGAVNVLGWRTVPRGPLAVVSQSGNMAHTFAQYARKYGSGFSRIVSIGNAADLTPIDYVDWLCDDPHTRVILVYAEGFGPGEGRAFCERIAAHPSRKPVVMLKPGATESGRRAALSHTGALAGEDRIVDAALRQCGVFRAQQSEEAFVAALALAQLPPMRSPNVVVVSDGGGHATVVSEALARAGLVTGTLSPSTQARLAELLPPRSAVLNPVDFSGRAEESPAVVPEVVSVCLADEEVGGVVLVGHFGGYFRDRTEATRIEEEDAARALGRAVEAHGKPFVLHTVYGADRLPALELLRATGATIVDSLELSASALAAVWKSGKRPDASLGVRARTPAVDTARVAALLARAAGSPPWLTEPDARELLCACGIDVPPFRVAHSADEAVAASTQLGAPVAMKLIATDRVHKSDQGGVLLDIADAQGARAGHESLMALASRAQARDAHVMLAAMIPDGIEAVVGALRDPQFGPVVMCGLGGVWAEALDDVSFRLAPIAQDEARAMIGELRAAKLFAGLRGRPPVDVDAFARLVVQVSGLVAALPQVVELDLNPVFVRTRGVAIADARVVLAPT